MRMNAVVWFSGLAALLVACSGADAAGSATSTLYHLTELHKLGGCDPNADRYQVSGCLPTLPAQ
jgi:hypothetical protein